MDVTDLDLESRLLAGLPIVNVFYERLGIDRLLETHAPSDARLRVSPAAALGVVIRNLVVRHAPVYALGKWASRYESSAVGLTADDVELLNDDRMGFRLRIRFAVDETQVGHDAASDGMWPLITNDRQMSPAELFTAYRWQPNLEKRHAQLKGTQLVAPMWLRDPARIEGLLTCHFIAMLIASLIERTIRQAMVDASLDELSLYPEDRGCTAPTTTRILEIFTGVARHELTDTDGQVLRTFHPELTDLQRQVLHLLDIPASVYSPVT